MSFNQLDYLKERIARFEEVVANYKRVREEILARRVGAVDHLMVELDERLLVNARTLEVFERNLALTRLQLKNEEAQISK